MLEACYKGGFKQTNITLFHLSVPARAGSSSGGQGMKTQLVTLLSPTLTTKKKLGTECDSTSYQEQTVFGEDRPTL